MTCEVGTCERCGIRRYIHPTRSPNLCHSCNLVQAVDEPSHALPPGRWVNDGLIKRWEPQTHFPSHAAFNTHKQQGEKPCFDCYEAERHYQNARKRNRRPGKLVPCGTHAAYVRHQRHGEEPCDICVGAERHYNSAQTRRQRAQQRQKEAA